VASGRVLAAWSVRKETRRESKDDRFCCIVIAASAGDLSALQTILAGLPADTPAAVVIVQHRSRTQSSVLDYILAKRARMPSSAIRTGAVDHVLQLDATAPALTAIMAGQPIDGAAAH
jgi:chemotaxis response regulator CheB